MLSTSRLITASLILATGFCTSASVQAAGDTALPGQQVGSLAGQLQHQIKGISAVRHVGIARSPLQQIGALGSHRSAHAWPRALPIFSQQLVRPRARTAQTASQLTLPDDVISAGHGQQSEVGPNVGNFRNLHHSWQGYVSGVAATFDFQPVATILYEGTVFTNSDAAQAFANDSFQTITSGSSIPPSDCSDTFGTFCKLTGYVSTNGNINIYTIAAVNQCVVEGGIVGTPDQIQANQDDITKAMASIFVVGVEEAKAACTGTPTPPSTSSSTPSPTATPQPTAPPTLQQEMITIDSDGILHEVNGQAKVTKTLKAKEQAIFVVFYHASGSDTPTGAVTFYAHGKKQFTNPMKQDTADDGTTYFYDPVAFNVTKTVKIKATFTLTMGQATASASLKFTVKASK